jgi:hypothetical protein
MKGILDEFLLPEAEIVRLSNECKVIADGYGQQDSLSKKLHSRDWNLLDNISRKLWMSDELIDQKILIGFELYETFPSYYHFLVPYYHIICYHETEDEQVKNIIWRKFADFLAAENHYCDPVGYVLWVEFFEDSNTVVEAWNGLMQHKANKKSMMKLLEYSGPVPFELKENLYNELVHDKRAHQSIFKSLLFSTYDLFGKIDKKKAYKLFMRLEVDKKTAHYQKLKDQLSA